MSEIGIQDKAGLQEVSVILKDLLKVIKVVSLYPENNPLPASLKRSFSDKLEWFVEDVGNLNFIIKKNQIYLDENLVYENNSKEDNLASIFFDAGITQLILKVGLSQEEIFSFLEIMKQYLNSTNKSLDIVGLFWEEGISNIVLVSLEEKYLNEYSDDFDYKKYMESKEEERFSAPYLKPDEVQDYSEIFNEDQQQKNRDELDDENIKIEHSSSFFEISPVLDSSTPFDSLNINPKTYQTKAASEAMGFDDLPCESKKLAATDFFFTDDFKKSREDAEMILKVINQDADFDPFESTVEILKEMLLQENELSAFSETVTICGKIIHEFISKSKLAEAGQILKFLKELQERIKEQRPLWADKIREEYATAGSRDRLNQLAETLNENDSINPVELKGYLENFGWEALTGISELIGQVEAEGYRQCLSEYLIKHGAQNVDLIGKGIFDKREDVIMQTIYILGKIGNQRALSYLTKVINHPEDIIRFELLNALKDNPDDNAVKILKVCSSDVNPEISKKAIDLIATQSGKQAVETMEEIIKSNIFPAFSDDDKKSLLVSYSQSGKEHAVSFLSSMASSIIIFYNKHKTFCRRAAFEALRINTSEKADLALKRLSKSIFPNVKHQAKSALLWRREHNTGVEQ